MSSVQCKGNSTHLNVKWTSIDSVIFLLSSIRTLFENAFIHDPRPRYDNRKVKEMIIR